MPSEENFSDAAPDLARRRRRLYMVMALLLIGYILVSRSGLLLDKTPAVRDFETMRTFARISVPEPAGGLTPEELADLAESAVRQVDRLMSPFGEFSDVRRLNEAAAGEWVEVDPLTWNVVMEALRWHRLTDGAFDPTIGPLKRLFVFDRSETDTWPDEETLAAARARVGADKLRFDREGMRLSWAADGMKLDLGAIAKGYSADLAAEALISRGVLNALIDVGGEVRVLGRNPKRTDGWQLGLRRPDGSGEVLRRLEPYIGPGLEELPADAGVATSGSYEQYFIYQGGRYEHIIDPRLGSPVRGGIPSVTAIYPGSCLAADALATSLCVLGPDAGREFLKSQTLGLFSGGVRVIMLMPLETGGYRELEMRTDTDGRFFEEERFLE